MIQIDKNGSEKESGWWMERVIEKKKREKVRDYWKRRQKEWESKEQRHSTHVKLIYTITTLLHEKKGAI